MRCLKPNSAQTGSDFDSALVLAQLNSLGVLETVRIRREGFPVRTDFAEIWALGWAAVVRVTPQASRLSAKQRAEAVLQRLPRDMWKLGHTKAFLRDGALGLLEAELAAEKAGSATAIQALARRRRASSQATLLAEAPIREGPVWAAGRRASLTAAESWL